MNLLERFIRFSMKEKTYKTILAIVLLFTIMHIVNFPMPYVFALVSDLVITITLCVFLVIAWGYIIEYVQAFYHSSKKKKIKYIKKEAKKIFKEILMYMPYCVITCVVISALIKGSPSNQVAVEESLGNLIILACIEIALIAPVTEEVIFRFLLYKIIKNKYLYIIIATFVFAGLHVINDPNPLYYIWAYIPDAFYFTWRYYKTKDILVTISLHSLGNIIALFSILL